MSRILIVCIITVGKVLFVMSRRQFVMKIKKKPTPNSLYICVHTMKYYLGKMLKMHRKYRRTVLCKFTMAKAVQRNVVRANLLCPRFFKSEYCFQNSNMTVLYLIRIAKNKQFSFFFKYWKPSECGAARNRLYFAIKPQTAGRDDIRRRLVSNDERAQFPIEIGVKKNYDLLYDVLQRTFITDFQLNISYT